MPAINSQHKALDAYYQTLQALAQHGATNEQATRLAFSSLLDALAKTVGWTLVLEQTLANRKRPDGTLYDAWKIPRGYWEAKDTGDDLDAEIRAKIARGYPLTNIVFEDTRRAVLYQNGRVALDVDITQRSQLVALLDAFFGYSGAQVAEFHAAVRQFQHDIPELARGLVGLIADERQHNQRFVAAFDHFHAICRAALNPQIGASAIEEMLVQHLLTERLFRTVFDNPDFTRRNAIASEIEKVIDVLTSRAFSRRDYLRKLDYFYLAIEEAARTISDFKEKQTFLNTVYERFFQGFSRDQADTHGIVYTPQPIVDWMCASVERVLQREWSLSLSSPGVTILDPATGTGNFVVNLLQRVSRRDLRRKYADELFANEMMLLPYYIASLNIEHAYYELSGEYAPFEGICFADTLDLAESPQLAMFGEENTERVERQRNAEIMVVIGNPPYNVGQKNENDNNKNRKYPLTDKRIAETYIKDSKATKTKSYDAYVRFFRWASDRLRGNDGIVCYVTSNSFVHKNSFDGMRKHLLHDFTTVYHLDLHGDVRENPKLSGTTHNVFGIQVGVGITIAIRSSAHAERKLFYYRVPTDWRKEQKLALLEDTKDLDGVQWQQIQPDARNTWLTAGQSADYTTLIPIGSKETKALSGSDAPAIFKTYSLGISTNRDEVAYDFDHEKLGQNIEQFIEAYNAEVARWTRSSSKDIDGFVHYDKIKWSRNLKRALQNKTFISFDATRIRKALYRPFTAMWFYQADVVVDELGKFDNFFPVADVASENQAIVVTDKGYRAAFSVFVTNVVSDLHLLATADGFQCFPLYVYDEDGGNRRENITDWALHTFRQAYSASQGQPPHQRLDGSNQDVKASTHDVEASTHDVETSTHDVETSTHTVEASTHTVEASTHTVEASTHTVETSTLNVETSTHDVEASTHDVEQSSLDVAALEHDANSASAAQPATSNQQRERSEPSSIISKRDIFHYVYALLHHPEYRARYAENLKRELPRIPLVASNETFWALVAAGEQLAALHLGYEQAPEYPLQWIENNDLPFSWRVQKMRLSPDKTHLVVNASLTLGAIPPEALGYRLGNRSALEWLIDQYQVTTDKRSGLVSDPNRANDAEYIVRLVGRVVTVSVETVRIVAGLPPLGLGAAPSETGP